ncbi:helix-turn-helix domain-containing protein [Alkalicoccus halolimnae]|uniref:Helix-turn-helix transcriptional regulator n=1 Tax=Alkalicoccus halolimnae TaxID=1667239 RepID=A0A5C7F7B9_9BACI|nr:helix-turn-helix transcriptional regulator [Alkalicoccus halolimnae]TXF85298.1 helix-turn-helix transcriptional regulator [Alkalicoccus halolimnae]
MKTIHRKEYEMVIQLLKEKRIAAELTQEDLAERLGQKQAYVSKYERCERRIDLIEFRMICQSIGLDALEVHKEFEVILRKKL